MKATRLTGVMGVRIDDVAGYDLHPGLRGSWGELIVHLKSTLA
jgi:hypothetical protein